MLKTTFLVECRLIVLKGIVANADPGLLLLDDQNLGCYGLHRGSKMSGFQSDYPVRL